MNSTQAEGYENTLENSLVSLATYFGLFFSLLSFSLTFFHFVINNTIKSILVIMNTINALCLITSLISDNFTSAELKCRIKYSSILAMSGTFAMGSVVSVLRLYMAKLASRAKIAKKSLTVPIITFGTILCYSTAPICMNIQESLGFRTYVLNCGESASQHFSKERNLLLPLLALFVFVMIISVGIYCDVAMYIFVRKRSGCPSNESRLVPWKRPKTSVGEDLQVPIRATIISTYIMLFNLTSVILWTQNRDTLDIQAPVAIVFIMTTTNLPTMLIFFTFKKTSRVRTSQPPQNLQFHAKDNIEDFETSHQNQPEIFRDAVQMNVIVEINHIQNVKMDVIISQNLRNVDVQ